MNPDNGLGGTVPHEANSFLSLKSAKLAHQFAVLARQDARAAKLLQKQAPRHLLITDSDYWTFDAYTEDTKVVNLLPELIKWTSFDCEAALEGSKAVLVYYREQVSTT